MDATADVVPGLVARTSAHGALLEAVGDEVGVRVGDVVRMSPIEADDIVGVSVVLPMFCGAFGCRPSCWLRERVSLQQLMPS